MKSVIKNLEKVKFLTRRRGDHREKQARCATNNIMAPMVRVKTIGHLRGHLNRVLRLDNPLDEVCLPARR